MASSPQKTVIIWTRREGGAWPTLRDRTGFRKLVVYYYLKSSASGSKDVWGKVYLEFVDGPQLVLCIEKVKTWFHNSKALKEGAVLFQLKCDMDKNGFDAKREADELLAMYHGKPLSVSYRESAAYREELAEMAREKENISPGAAGSDDVQEITSVKHAPRATVFRTATLMRALSAAGAGAAAGASDDNNEAPTLDRTSTIAYESAGDALAGIVAAINAQTEAASSGLKLLNTRLQHLCTAMYTAGRVGDVSFAANRIAVKKAETKAAAAKERDAAMKKPDGPDGTDDIVGDAAKTGLSQQNIEAQRVMAKRQAAATAAVDPKEKQAAKRKVAGAALAADPSARQARAKRSRGRGAAAAAAAACSADAAEADDGDAKDDDNDHESGGGGSRPAAAAAAAAAGAGAGAGAAADDD